MFCIKTMFGSSLSPVVCRKAHVLFTLFVFAYSGVQHIFCSGFDLFFFVLCALCCQFLWIVHFWLTLRYSLTFIEHDLVDWVDVCDIRWFLVGSRFFGLRSMSCSQCCQCQLIVHSSLPPTVFSNVYLYTVSSSWQMM